MRKLPTARFFLLLFFLLVASLLPCHSFLRAPTSPAGYHRCSFGLEAARKQQCFLAFHHLSGNENAHRSLAPPPSSTSLPLSLLKAVSNPGREDPEEENVTNKDDDGEEILKVNNAYTPLTWTQKIMQPIQLAVTIWLLLLLPASLYSSPTQKSLYGAVTTLGTLPYEYFLLFALGTLPRQWRFGKFTKTPSSTSEGGKGGNNASSSQKRGTSKFDFVLFQVSLFICHWIGVKTFMGATTAADPSTVETTRLWVLALLRWTSIGLNAWAAWILGSAYDRVTKPQTLITTGPYAWVRHPIYTSYLLLFGSGLLSLGSVPAFCLLMVSATIFYSGRMQAEDDILRKAFPEEYNDYEARVPNRLLPLLL